MNTTIEKIERLNIILVGVSAVVGWGTGYVHPPSLIVGGVVMQVNFWLLKKVVRTALCASAGSPAGKSRAAVWFLAKGLFFLALLSALFVRYPIHGGSFAVGVSLLLVSCVIIGLSEQKTPIREIKQIEEVLE